jgi:hypothetical protein
MVKPQKRFFRFLKDRVEYYNYYVMWFADEMVLSNILSQDIQNLLESTKQEHNEKERSG